MVEFPHGEFLGWILASSWLLSDLAMYKIDTRLHCFPISLHFIHEAAQHQYEFSVLSLKTS